MKELLERVLTPKIVVSTVPKNDLMIVVPHFEKPSLQICSSVNRVIKNKLPYCNLRIVSQTKRKLINSITFKDNIPVFLRSTSFLNLSALAALLPMMAKLSTISKSKCANTLDFLFLLEEDNDSVIDDSES